MRTATYRVQLHAEFTFDDAAAIIGYLADLGVSHLYCSPYLQAAPGSTHGYDVTDHSSLNAELGGMAGHRRLVKQLANAGLGQVLDIVPNHMALGKTNAWWWDVLENGPSSRYASYFDIDWDPPERKLTANVLMPVLGDHYGRVLEAGELAVERRDGSFVVRYHEHEAPISPRSIDELLGRAARRAGSAELASLAAAHGELPHAILTDPAAVAERHRGKEELRQRLAALCCSNPDVAAAIDAEVTALNADPDALDQLLDRQNYRLAYWATAAEELSYRRFFNIETLAGLRMEDPEVFADTHRLILELVRDGTVDGLRIDHVDGLADPQGYLDRLRDATGSYVVVEKILAPDEELPSSWPTAGTTGYDFLNRVTQLYTDQAGAEPMRACYSRFTANRPGGSQASYDDIARLAKLQIMREELAAELERLTALLADICERHRRQRDHTRRELRTALAELIASFGVYRTYAYPGREVSTADREHVAAAVAQTLMQRPDLDPELIGFLGELILLGHPGEPETQFAIRFAQVSAPVMAKAVEDTAFYRYVPLASLNEVGGAPELFGRPVSAFHADMASAAAQHPEAMLTLSTHDTKRSGDVRARTGLLAELPRAWEQAVTRWADHNGRHKRNGWPDPHAEYLLYQSLVGAWPIDAPRARDYLAKAAREAKVHTSWIDPDPGYDDALSAFVDAVLADQVFVADLENFLAEHRLVELGRVTSLAQLTLLLTCPGVPDIYQGAELWDLSLVDPDNRRPVDYAVRSALLADLTGAGPDDALARTDVGGPKLWLISRALGYRRRHPAIFGPGSDYHPLPAEGAKAEHVVAFLRDTPGKADGLVVVVPRLAARLAGDWADTTVHLPPGRWTNVLGDAEPGTGTGRPSPAGPAFPGGQIRVAELLSPFPVVILGRAG
ncbi:MAG: malto-oligosyltrehalose synthase [Streptosporangiaceae bacterium]